MRENLKIFLPASLVSCGASLVRFLDPADPTSSQSGNLTSASEPKDLLTEPANDAREVLSKTIPSIWSDILGAMKCGRGQFNLWTNQIEERGGGNWKPHPHISETLLSWQKEIWRAGNVENVKGGILNLDTNVKYRIWTKSKISNVAKKCGKCFCEKFSRCRLSNGRSQGGISNARKM